MPDHPKQQEPMGGKGKAGMAIGFIITALIYIVGITGIGYLIYRLIALLVS